MTSQVAQAGPNSYRALLDAARELRRMSRLDETEALYRSDLERQPAQVRALVNLGRIAAARGNVRLDGLNVAMLGSFRGNVWDKASDFKDAIFMDERADEPQ